MKNPFKKYPQPEEDPDSFGNICLQYGYIDHPDLFAALKEQARRSPLLGEVMVSLGMLSDLQRDEIVAEQQKRRATTKAERAAAQQQLQTLSMRKVRTRLATLSQTMLDIAKK